jgi:hypothetical protein
MVKSRRLSRQCHDAIEERRMKVSFGISVSPRKPLLGQAGTRAFMQVMPEPASPGE